MVVGGANGPFELITMPEGDPKADFFVYMAIDMALGHNAYIRALNSIYAQAAGVSTPKDITDLLVFVQCWCDSVHHHHDVEEQLFFPAVEKETNSPGIMASNIAGHAAFHDGLEKFSKYAYETKPDTYSADALKAIIDEFGPPCVEHLHEEIPTLLELRKYPEENIRRAHAIFDHGVMKTTDKWRTHPLILGNCDNTYANGIAQWPPIPAPVYYVVAWVFAGKHRGAWRFNSADFWGTPRALPFAK